MLTRDTHPERAVIQLWRDGRCSLQTTYDLDREGSLFAIDSPADADAELAATRDTLDAWYDRLQPQLSASDWVKLQLDIAALETDRWHTTATRVIAAVFDEGREQPNVIVRRTLPGDTDAAVRRRRTEAGWRWRGQRIAYGGLALCLVSLGLGYGAALLAGRRLGR